MSSIEPRAIFASLPRTVRGTPIVLGADPKGKNFLYVNGKNVIIRSIENPVETDVYSQHTKDTSCAKYAPSGFYIASGDVGGKLRIWDTTQKEHILKYEYQVLGGTIKDISWTEDSKRIAVCGEGRDLFASVFLWDSGSSVGQLNGQSKFINSIDIKQNRPYRLVTASEDFTAMVFEGPPFKMKETKSDHSNFVNVVRYSPNGELFASGSADGKVFSYDGKTSEARGEIGCPAHKAGVYALCFSPDSRKLVTVSADKTAKVWDSAEKTQLFEYYFGKELLNMQVGCLWTGDTILTVSLSGHINYLDGNNPTSVYRTIKGHNKLITAMALSEDKSTIFTGSYDSLICYWDSQTGLSDEMTGKGHSNQIQKMVVNGDDLVTVSLDDTIRISSVSARQYTDRVVPLDSQPKCVASRGPYTIATTINGFVVLEEGKMIGNHKVPIEPEGIDIHPGLSEVAVGSRKDNSLHIFGLSNGTLTERETFPLNAVGMDVKYSPDGAYLVVGCDDKKVHLFECPSYKKVYENASHGSRVTAVAWAPDSQHFATVGIDGCIIGWKLKLDYSGILCYRGAHGTGAIMCLEWLNSNVIVTAGHDCNIRQWNINIK